MKKLARFFATFLLVASISAVALADGDGGVAQGPPAPALLLAPECTMDCSNSAVTFPAPTSDVTTDLANNIVTWLVEAIL
jgi:hypothetical protein